MIFTRGHIQGFGRLRDFRFDFRSGLNIVFAPNEGGKSTLQHFLLGVIYGQLRADLKLQRRLDPWVERFKPWQGEQYGGMLECLLENGRELEIRRAFGKEETGLEIRTSTGEDITRQYEQQRNGDVLFAKHHFGMPKELYESLGVIRENRIPEIDSRDTIRDRLANLAQSGDEELSIGRILNRLTGMLDSIGSDRAPTKPYRQARDLVGKLQTESKLLEDQRTRYGEWLQEKNRAAELVRASDLELFKIRDFLFSAKKQAVAARIESLKGIAKDIEELRKRIDTLQAREDFPLDRLEELNQLVGAGDSISKRLGEVRSEKEASLSQLDSAESQRRELEIYADFAESTESEKITERFMGYLGFSLQREKLKKEAERLQGESEILKKRLGRLGPDLKNPEMDWDSFAREAAEEEQAASRKCSLLAEDLAKEKTKFSEAVRTAFNRRVGGVLLVGAAAAPLAVQSLIRLNELADRLQYGFSAVCLVLSAWMWWSAARIYRRGRAAEKRVRELELEGEEAKQRGETKRKELDAAIKNSGFRSLDAFIKAARQSAQDREKLEDLVKRMQDLESQDLQQQARSDETFRILKEDLARVGLACTPGNLKSQVDFLRGNLRRFRELDGRYRRCVQTVEALDREESALDAEHRAKQARLDSILQEAGTQSVARFREEASKCAKAKELVEKEASRKREFDRLADGHTVEEWDESLKEIGAQIAKASAEKPADLKQPEEEASGALLLPYLPSVPELEDRERTMMSRLSDARQEYAHAVERVRHAFQNFRPSSEIEEDLSLAERKLKELELNREALAIAVEKIENLSRHQQEVLAPQLNAAVERRFVKLCNNRYSEVKIDPDFKIYLRETDSGELRSADLMSRGTQDQLYFTIRFGILDLVSNGEEPCPCLLDEPFAAYDRPRIAEAFNILSEESSRRQLILFTCREDLLDMAGRTQAHVLRLAV